VAVKAAGSRKHPLDAAHALAPALRLRNRVSGRLGVKTPSTKDGPKVACLNDRDRRR